MEIVLILSDIRSIHNVGSIFRSADAFGVTEIVCAGYTPTPEHPELAKTALGAESTIKWRAEDIEASIERLKKNGYTICALEIGGEPIQSFAPGKKIALIFGNETEGVSEDILKLADITLEIPMHGKKESLNVSVTAGIALYAITESLFRI